MKIVMPAISLIDGRLKGQQNILTSISPFKDEPALALYSFIVKPAHNRHLTGSAENALRVKGYQN